MQGRVSTRPFVSGSEPFRSQSFFQIAMRRLFFLILVLTAGCTVPTGPSNSPAEFEFGTSYPDFYLNRNPIPFAKYSGIFSASVREWDYIDTAHADTTSLYLEGSQILYNALGNEIYTPVSTVSLSINGFPIHYRGYFNLDSGHVLNFPSPVTWSFIGDDYFPSFTHVLKSETPINILNPPQSDSQSASQGFTVDYSAPGADTVTITLFYDGKGMYSNDTADTLEDVVDFTNALVPNTGHYVVMPFHNRDSTFLKSFTPQSVEVSVAWARGDTIHADGKIFGFVTEAVCSREYNFKP